MKKKKRKNLNTKISNLYIIASFFFMIGFIFFGTSKLFITEEIPINETKLHQEIDLRAEGKFIINKWIYDEENNMMELNLETNGLTNYSSNLSFSSVTKNNVKKELPTEIVFNEEDIYIITIKQIPKNFEQIAVRFHKTNKNLDNLLNEKKEDTKTICTIYADERTIENAKILEKDSRNYSLEVIDGLIEKSILQKEELQIDIEKIDSFIRELNVEIDNLKSNLSYQTMDEQIKTNNQIYQIEREIETKNRDKEVMLQDIKNLELKIEKLNQKKQDISL